MSRIPMAAAAPAPRAPPLRTYMLRTVAAPRPRVAHHRPHPAAQRPVGRVARASLVHRRPRPALAQAPHIQPTPYVVAARAMAAPAAFTLISDTICDSGAPPRLMALLGPPASLPETGVAPGVDGVPNTGVPETGFPDIGFPSGRIFPPQTGGVVPPGGGFPPGPPIVGPVSPPVGPPAVTPPRPETPPETPPPPPMAPPVAPPPGPDTPPPVIQPVTGGPPIPPPFVPPPITPPSPIVPPIGGAPEPGVWAMLLLGFGAVGATLRRRRRVAAREAQIEPRAGQSSQVGGQTEHPRL